jgi:ABC-type bacteriocin/lantibiotic exporter with double-glycine peptidase domain
LIIKNGEFKWDRNSDRASLSNINVKVKPGELVMVVGEVGSGKSTLAMAALGDITQVNTCHSCYSFMR